MLQSNGQRVRLNGYSVNTTGNARNASKVKPAITAAQAEFISFITGNDIRGFSESLKLVHDFALYHTDLPLDDDEKFALYNVKLLWEELDKLSE